MHYLEVLESGDRVQVYREDIRLDLEAAIETAQMRVMCQSFAEQCKTSPSPICRQVHHKVCALHPKCGQVRWVWCRGKFIEQLGFVEGMVPERDGLQLWCLAEDIT